MYNIDDTYLRPKKAASLKNMYATTFERKDELAVWSGKNATVLPLRKFDGDQLVFGRGGVVDESGEYVPLSGMESRLYLGYPFENPVFKEEKVVYCGYLINQWGHFLVEAVNRLWYVLENDTTVDKYVFMVHENEQRTLKGNYKEFFELLKIADKIEIINTPTTYREVIVPEMAFRCMKYYSPKYTDLYDAVAANVIPDPSWPSPEKIFLTRSQFTQGSIYEFGLDSLDNFYSKNGYTIIAPEKVSLSQLIYYIRNANEVASLSGSLQHNMLFAPMHKKHVILERLVINIDFTVSVNQMRQLDVTYIDANYPIYTVSTCGPFIMGYNEILERYARENQMLPPDAEFTSEKYLDKCFKQYMRSYQDNYRSRWYMADWYWEIADTLWEGYQDGYRYFADYLDGKKPYLREHYFQWHYFKQFIKRLLKIQR